MTLTREDWAHLRAAAADLRPYDPHLARVLIRGGPHPLLRALLGTLALVAGVVVLCVCTWPWCLISVPLNTIAALTLGLQPWRSG